MREGGKVNIRACWFPLWSAGAQSEQDLLKLYELCVEGETFPSDPPFTGQACSMGVNSPALPGNMCEYQRGSHGLLRPHCEAHDMAPSKTGRLWLQTWLQLAAKLQASQVE